MIQPEALKKDERLPWSTGSGVDVWEMFRACVAGDLPTVERLVGKDPALVRSHHAYRTPLYFAVRENRIDVAAFLLERGADPFGLAVERQPARDLPRSRVRGAGEPAGGALRHHAERLAPGRGRRRGDPRSTTWPGAPPPRRLTRAAARRRRAIEPADPLGGDDAPARRHRRAAGARCRHRRAALRRRAADPAHERRLPLPRLARRAPGLADHAGAGPRAPARAGRLLRHQHGVPHRRPATGCASSSTRTLRWPTGSRTTSRTTSAPGRRCGTPPPPGTARSSSCSSRTGRTRTCPKRASHRAATRSTRRSRTGTSRSPGSSWSTVPSRTRRSRAPPTP